MKRRFSIVARLAAALFAVLSFSVASFPVFADELSVGDLDAIQKTVRQQIDALSNDDAAGAFALTARDMRDKLGDADNFLQIIKHEYDPVYRHQVALYSPPQVVDGNIYQVVRLTDMDNHVWIAIYLMGRDEGGEWKVQGCQLLETSTVSV
jgi:hypothetical protein